MVRRYELVFSLGAACACTECLREAGLQYGSFPFDWLVGSTLARRTDMLADGCEDWLRPDALKHVLSVTAIRTDAYLNVVTDITFNHDFPAGVPLAESIAGVRAKYDRRFERLRSLIGRGGPVLAVYVSLPSKGVPPTAEEAAACRRRLSERFPTAAFDVLVLRPGENAEPVVEQVSEGVTFATFDYRSRTDTTGANPVDRDRVVAFLKSLGLSARDYRSAAERRARRKAERARRFARFGAKNAWECLWVTLQYKLCRHLAKRLAQKGVI